MAPLALALAAAVAATPAPEAVDVLVFVPLCDGAQLACGGGPLGDPHAPAGNLYWGALYGADRVLRRSAAFRPATSAPAPDDPSAAAPILARRAYTRAARTGERPVRVTLLAYDGTAIDRALADFVDATAHRRADLVVWMGHDRLMDVRAPAVARAATPADVAVLACESEQYFRPVLDALGARSVALTRTFMAPEGYLLEAMLASVARHGPSERVELRRALIDAYARWQKITPRAAGTVFSDLGPR